MADRTRRDAEKDSLDDGHHCCICETDFDTIVELIKHDCDEYRGPGVANEAAGNGGEA